MNIKIAYTSPNTNPKSESTVLTQLFLIMAPKFKKKNAFIF